MNQGLPIQGPGTLVRLGHMFVRVDGGEARLLHNHIHHEQDSGLGFQEVTYPGAADKVDFLCILCGFWGTWPCLPQVLGGGVGCCRLPGGRWPLSLPAHPPLPPRPTLYKYPWLPPFRRPPLVVSQRGSRWCGSRGVCHGNLSGSCPPFTHPSLTCWLWASQITVQA